MDTVRNLLKPLIQMFPDSAQEFLNTDVGTIVLLLAIVVVVALVGAVALSVLKGILGGTKRKPASKPKAELDLSAHSRPAAPTPAPAQRIFVSGEPVRLRMVVLAPAGSESDLDPTQVAKLLDKAVPGLSKQYAHDQPSVKTLPAQVSVKGFPPTFFRKTGLSAEKGDLSRWVLVAGRCVVGKRSFLLGLALWADKPCSVGHVTVEPDRWQELFRIRTAAEDEE